MQHIWRNAKEQFLLRCQMLQHDLLWLTFPIPFEMARSKISDVIELCSDLNLKRKTISYRSHEKWNGHH